MKVGCPIVSFGGKIKGFIKGRGTLKCNYVEFSNVSYFKSLKYNLIAISQLCDVDYEVHFNKKEGVVIGCNKKVVLNAKRKDDINILDMFSIDKSLNMCFLSISQSHLSWLWKKDSLILISKQSQSWPIKM